MGGAKWPMCGAKWPMNLIELYRRMLCAPIRAWLERNFADMNTGTTMFSLPYHPFHVPPTNSDGSLQGFIWGGGGGGGA